MKKHLITAIAATASLAISASAKEPQKSIDCSKVREVIKAQTKADDANLLEIIQRAIAENESCACEIVKAAIASSDASTEEVAAIVETAITEAPEKANLIAQCAIAIAPDAIKNVQAVLAKFDKNAGESAPSGKYSPKDVDKGGIPPVQDGSVLDFPAGPGGPDPSNPGVNQVTLPPFFFPPVAPPTIGVTPPDVTQVNGMAAGGGSSAGDEEDGDIFSEGGDFFFDLVPR